MIKPLFEGNDYQYYRLFGHCEFNDDFIDVIKNGMNDDIFQRKFFFLNEGLRESTDDIHYSWFRILKHTKGLYSMHFPQKKFNNLRFLVMRTKINKQDVMIFLEGFYEKGDSNQSKGYNKYIKTAEYRMSECIKSIRKESV